MKMVLHQAVNKCFGNGVNMMRVKLKEIPKVTLLPEQVFVVIATIVDMVIMPRI
jgi:hypothetical protein